MALTSWSQRSTLRNSTIRGGVQVDEGHKDMLLTCPGKIVHVSWRLVELFALQSAIPH